MSHGKIFAFSVLAVALLSVPSLGSAQIGVYIGVAPVCPYGYFDYAPYDCSPYGYYGPDWFVGGVFLEPVHGFAGAVDSTATSTTALTLATDTEGRCLNVARCGSTTFRAMRRGTGAAMWATLVTRAVASTRYLDIAAVDIPGDIATRAAVV